MGHFTSPPFSLSFSLAPSFHNLSLSSFFPPLSCSLNLSLSLCEGHAIDFPLSIHFSRLALKRGKQTKATTAPPLSLHPSPLLHPPPFPSLSAGPRPVQKPSDKGESGGMQPPPPSAPPHRPPPLRSPHSPLLPPSSPPFLFIPSTFVPSPPLCPTLPFSWISDHIPLTELKSCITLKTLPMHCG